MGRREKEQRDRKEKKKVEEKEVEQTDIYVNNQIGLNHKNQPYIN